MKFSDIRDLGKTELLKKKNELQADLFQANMKNTMGQLSNPVQIRFIRRDLAKIETALVLTRMQGK